MKLPRSAALAGPLLLLASAPACGASSPPVLEDRYAAFDTCGKLPGAAAFRAKLERAVKARNVEALVGLTAPDVRLDFGGGEGHDQLRDRLTGEQGAKLWHELDRILPLGCADDEGMMVLPSIFALDFGDIDGFEVMVVTGKLVPLMPNASRSGTPLRLLSGVLVEPLSGDDFERPFRHVRITGTELEGYVATDKLRSPIDYRMGANRTDGAWKIDFFLAGD